MLVKLPYDMDHVSTRAVHLAELQDLWSFAYGTLIAGSYHSDMEREHTLELGHALDLLERHMLSQYRPAQESGYAKIINELPKNAEDIKDSQGESNYGIT